MIGLIQILNHQLISFKAYFLRIRKSFCDSNRASSDIAKPKPGKTSFSCTTYKNFWQN